MQTMLDFFHRVFPPEVVGGTWLVVVGSASKARPRACVCWVEGEQGQAYMLTSGRCTSRQRDTFAPYAGVGVDSVGAAYIGHVARGRLDLCVWGLDYAVVHVSRDVVAKPGLIGEERIVGVLRFEGVARNLVVGSAVCVGGHRGFTIVSIGESDSVPEKAIDVDARGRHTEIVEGRVGPRMVVARGAGVEHTPAPGDPVSVVAPNATHVLVGMVCAHLKSVHKHYIVQFLDHVLDAEAGLRRAFGES